MPLLDHFGLLAPFYEVFIPPKSPEKIQLFAQLPVRGALLDAGGGTGRVAQFLRGQADQVVVVDLSCKMLKVAGGKDGLHPVCAHTERLPFPDGLFARIIMVDALHHVCDQRHTSGELWRVLQPGGRLVIEEPDIRTWAVRLLGLAEKLALMRSHFLAPPQIADLYRYPDSRVHMETEKAIAWVVVEKNP
jgi:demethylmenaquinone methyltransferase/2-methoxy-6-polyprenyl-1,4-benzoquinol methylase